MKSFIIDVWNGPIYVSACYDIKLGIWLSQILLSCLKVH